MSKGSLDGCWAKLDRADEQLRALDVEIQDWFKGGQGDVYEFSAKPDHRDGFMIYKYRDVKPTPLRFAVIVGEIVHDMRSSLDHLVEQLLRRSSKGSSPSNQFPICTREFADPAHPGIKAWNTHGKGALQGVKSGYRAIIENAQPYKRGHSIHKHPLYALNDLWNEDKHRILHLMAFGVSGKYAAKAGKIDMQGFSGMHISVRVFTGPIEESADAMGVRVESAPFGFPPNMNVHAQYPVGIGFGDGDWGVTDLQKLGVYIIRKILNPYAPLFGEKPVRGHPLTKPIRPTPSKVAKDRRLEPLEPHKYPFRTNNWKVWFDSDRGLTEHNIDTPPAWFFVSPVGATYEVPALGLTEAEFRVQLVSLAGLAVCETVRKHFEPREFVSILGQGFFPARGLPLGEDGAPLVPALKG